MLCVKILRLYMNVQISPQNKSADKTLVYDTDSKCIYLVVLCVDNKAEKRSHLS